MPPGSLIPVAKGKIVGVPPKSVTGMENSLPLAVIVSLAVLKFTVDNRERFSRASNVARRRDTLRVADCALCRPNAPR